MRRRRWVGLVVVLPIVLPVVLLAAACTATPELPSATGTVPVGSATPATTAPLSWTACGARVQCATLTVPVDHADPGGPTIDLPVVRRPATDADNRIGSLIVDPGGPGASGVEFVRDDDLDDELAARFDLVGWDPRGVGLDGSSSLDCGDEAAFATLDWSPDDDQERAALDTAATAIAEDCQGASDVLAHLGTDETAQDLDDLRAAVGDEQLTYLGFSYGTAIGLAYAQRFPTKVRAIVLDGVVDPTEDLEGSLAGQTGAMDAQMKELFASCVTGPCPLADPAGTYDRLAAQAEQAPLDGDVGPTLLAFAAISASYDEAFEQDLLRALAAAERGDASGLRDLAGDYFGSGGYGSYLAITCADLPHPEGGAAYDELVAHLTARSPRFGPTIANELRPCAFWPSATSGRPGPVTASGAPPILVVGNAGDSATPLASAQAVAAQLERGMLLTFEGTGHTSFGKSDCVDEAVRAYLVDLAELRPGSTVCR